MSKKKIYSLKLFLLVLPFIVLVILFCYYPLYGWMYAFYDYKPPKTLANCPFVGFKWFASLVSSETKIKQIIQVLKNTFAMSGITIGTSWLPMLFAVFLNEINRTFRSIKPFLTVFNVIIGEGANECKSSLKPYTFR